ncbi:MAG: hypothetical protein IPN95_01290 [Bacteroidetes bacterium]|nr:hypothetical protein [Bacteroidota bacterium]MBL0015266.1 hypothetical protein [Bacteroidota bacterium]MBP6638914.1 hypothetical protein [Bacteroidia bacterium]MBP6721924.1 hypothetical protein [Bacteroidia bacterium]
MRKYILAFVLSITLAGALGVFMTQRLTPGKAQKVVASSKTSVFGWPQRK